MSVHCPLPAGVGEASAVAVGVGVGGTTVGETGTSTCAAGGASVGEAVGVAVAGAGAAWHAESTITTTMHRNASVFFIASPSKMAFRRFSQDATRSFPRRAGACFLTVPASEHQHLA